MTDACREVSAAQIVDAPDAQLAERIAAHLTHCDACRTRIADHTRLAAALRGADTEIDEVAQARLLARMAPTLDDLASRRARPASRRAWLPIAAFAAAAGIVLAVWAATGRTTTAPVAAVPRARDIVRPYLVAGASSEAAAATLLAGRFSALAVEAGETVRASTDDGTRITLVGPGHLTVVAVEPELDLELGAGTLLVTATTPAIHVHGAGFDVRASNATFAVSSDVHPVIFVDRGTIELDGTQLHAGEWSGAAADRSLALVRALRDHADAIAAPHDPSGILAVPGPSAAVVTEGGGVLGTAPLWARVPLGPIALVVVGDVEQRATLAITERGIARVERTTQVIAPVTPVAPISPVAPVRPTASITHHPAAVPDPAVAVPARDASQLYADAERRLGTGDRTGAERALDELLEEFPDSPQAASALYDLANLARARGDLAAARSALDRLVALDATALREPASYLRCRVDVESKRDAAPCFRAFRRAFPSSAHDAEVLAWLVGHASTAEGCVATRALADEYLRSYPTDKFAGEARKAAACTP
ncbi:MAG TPA: outer membrane protein assembly factor BamD [Kofleriaceae bacterium]